MTTLHTVKLTAKQAEVLVRIYTSATPEIAKAETEYGEKAIASAQVLKDLNAITVDEEGATVTATGIDLMKQQGLLDNEDNLTQEAERYSAGDGRNTADQPEDDLGLDADMGAELPDDEQSSDSLDDLLKTESLMVSVNRLLKKS